MLLNRTMKSRGFEEVLMMGSDHTTRPERLIALHKLVTRIHGRTASPSMLLWPSSRGRISELSDLPRLLIHECSFSGDDRTGVSGLQASDDDWKKIESRCWDLVILSADELMQGVESGILRRIVARVICVVGRDGVPDEGSTRTALPVLRALRLEPDPEYPFAFSPVDKIAHGKALLAHGRLIQAYRWYSSFLSDDPPDTAVVIALGDVCLRLGDSGAGESFLRMALRTDPCNRAALFRLIDIYRDRGDTRRLTSVLEQTIAATGDDPGILDLLAKCYSFQGRFEEETSILQRLERIGSGKRDPSARSPDTGARILRRSSRIFRNKILVITNLFPPQELGGYGRLMWDFTDILRRRGHRVRVLTSDTSYLGPAGDDGDVVRALKLFGSWNGGRLLVDETSISAISRSNEENVVRTLEEFRPDVCLLGNLDLIGPSILSRIIEQEIPVLHHLGNKSPGYSPRQMPCSGRYHLAAASAWLRDLVWREYPLEEISVIYPGARVGEFYEDRHRDLSMLRIAYAGILLPYKGPHLLVEALVTLQREGVEFQATLAGTSTDPSFVASLRDRCVGAGIAVEFPGNLDREGMRTMFRTHNVLVFPSLVDEAFGISQVEAMAAGLCVVGSATGGAAEVVEEGISGVVFQSGSSESLADKLLHLARNPDYLERVRLCGRKRALERFDIETSVDRIEEIFCRLLQEHG